MKMRRVALVGVILGGISVLGVALYAADDAPWKAPVRAGKKVNPVTADDASIAAGKDLYAKHCLSCHGATGKGNGPAAKDLEKSPGDLSNPKLWEQTEGELFWKITTGKKPMPAFEDLASETDRWNIVNYTRTLAPKPAATQSTTDGEKK